MARLPAVVISHHEANVIRKARGCDLETGCQPAGRSRTWMSRCHFKVGHGSSPLIPLRLP